MDKADKVMAKAEEMFGKADHPGLNNAWANIPAYVE